MWKLSRSAVWNKNKQTRGKLSSMQKVLPPSLHYWWRRSPAARMHPHRQRASWGNMHAEEGRWSPWSVRAKVEGRGRRPLSLPSQGPAVKEVLRILSILILSTGQFFFVCFFHFLSLRESMLQTRGSHSSLRQSHLKSETGQRREKKKGSIRF